MVCIFFLSACDKKQEITYENLSLSNSGSQLCTSIDLPVVPDGKTCHEGDDEVYFEGVCRRVRIDETLYLDDEAYAWYPEICEEGIGTELIFRSGQDVTKWNIVQKEHFISEKKLVGFCSWSSSLAAAVICQKNEVIRTSYLSELIGPDTLSFELQAQVSSIEEDDFIEKTNVLRFSQVQNISNLLTFELKHTVGSTYNETARQAYLEEVTLNGMNYKDVLMKRFGDTLYDEPNTWYYFQKGVGILGFKINDKLWIRE